MPLPILLLKHALNRTVLELKYIISLIELLKRTDSQSYRVGIEISGRGRAYFFGLALNRTVLELKYVNALKRQN